MYVSYTFNPCSASVKQSGEVTMENQAASAKDIKATILEEWRDAAPLWQKWYPKLSWQSRSATELIVKGAALSSGQHVLDLASGSGEPALSIAKAVGASGRVVATDMVPEMLDGARENAAAQGLSNLEFKVADAESLPFGAGEFDRVTARFGLMFFPDINKALTEVRRVLKPGGRISFVVWGPPDGNPLFSTMTGPFLKHVQMPAPPPDAPSVFRFADESKLAGVLSAAGFHSVKTAKTTVDWPWPGPPEEAWLATSELAAPFKKMMAALPPEKRPSVVAEVIAGISRYYDGKQVNFPASLISVQAGA
jgi:ubiquinone/menaquinone biosynthesis C-methylase UbiE